MVLFHLSRGLTALSSESTMLFRSGHMQQLRTAFSSSTAPLRTSCAQIPLMNPSPVLRRAFSFARPPFTKPTAQINAYSRLLKSKPSSQAPPLSRATRFFSSTRPGYRSYQRQQGGWQPLQRLYSTKRTVWLVVGINTAVYAIWEYSKYCKSAKLQYWLVDNTLLSWGNIRAQRYWTAVTSAFTHMDFNHYLFNMFGLVTFGSVFYGAGGIGLGVGHVFFLTVGSALAGSAASLYYRKNRNAHSLGASGVVMGYAATATCLAPFQPRMLLFPPVPIPLWGVVAAYIALDYYSLGGNSKIGHEAHLAGAGFGALYYLTYLRGFGGVSQLLRFGRRF